MTGKRWIDIWLVFISLDFEMRFDNSTRAIYILYIDLVETLNFLWINYQLDATEYLFVYF